MKEALEKAAADLPFQFFLARLFGQYQTAVDGNTEVQGYGWRGQLFVTKIVRNESAKPNSDSQHRSSPDF